jgi:hypothetical protein
MKRPLTLASAVLVGCIVAMQVPRVSSGDKKEAQKQETSASLRRLMNEKFDIPDAFKAGPVPFKIVLKYLTDAANARGRELEIAVDQRAFDTSMNILLDENVELPIFMRKLTVDQWLEITLSQLPGQARYRIRNGVVEITTAEKASVAQALKQNVVVDFQSRTPASALEELSDLTGLSIGIDPTCEEVVLKRIVSLRTNKDTTLRAVLETIADSCEFKLLVTDERVMVLPQAVYMKRLRDRLEETKVQREIDGLWAPNSDRPQFVPAAPDGKAAGDKGA